MGSQPSKPSKPSKNEVPPPYYFPDPFYDQFAIPVLLRLSHTSPDWAECSKGNEMVLLRDKMRTIVGRHGAVHLEITCGAQPVRYLVGRYEYNTTIGEMLERSKSWIDQGREICAKHRADSEAKICPSDSKIVVISSCLPKLNNDVGMWGPFPAQERNSYLDIGFHQSLLRNRGATVMLPSSSTGQCVDEYDKPKNRTEGVQSRMRCVSAAAALSAAPGLLFRNYFMSSDPDDMHSARRFTAESDLTHQINLLDGEGLRQVLEPSDNLLVYMPNMSAQERRDYLRSHPGLYQKMKVARHDFVQVTYGVRDPAVHWGWLYRISNPLMRVVEDTAQFVNQVFFVNELNFLDRDGQNQTHKSTRLDEQFMFQIYQAHWLGAIIAAKENSEFLRDMPDCHGSRRLILPIDQNASLQEVLLTVRALRSAEVFPAFVASALELFILCGPEHWPVVTYELKTFTTGVEHVKIPVENIVMEDETFETRMKELFSGRGYFNGPESQKHFDPSHYRGMSRTKAQDPHSEMCCWEESRPHRAPTADER